jgi:hypothetical protein
MKNHWQRIPVIGAVQGTGADELPEVIQALKGLSPGSGASLTGNDN